MLIFLCIIYQFETLCTDQTAMNMTVRRPIETPVYEDDYKNSDIEVKLLLPITSSSPTWKKKTSVINETSAKNYYI